MGLIHLSWNKMSTYFSSIKILVLNRVSMIPSCILTSVFDKYALNY